MESVAKQTPSFVVVKNDQLFVSEPDPYMFGNSENEPSNPSWTNGNWLKSRFHFSFAEWRRGPSSFGPLRVLNDDLVQPSRGFGEHPHRDMEIVTYIVSGAITHKDSTGSAETLGAHSVQYMTAGTGVRHSEFNNSKTEPVRFIQVWFLPRSSSIRPNYGSYNANGVAPPKNVFTQLVDDVQAPSEGVPVHLNQDVKFSVAFIEPGQSVTYKSSPNRLLYILQIEGNSNISSSSDSTSAVLLQHEAARLTNQDTTITFANTEASTTSHVGVFDLGGKP